eukprot:scaffold412516_cov41-Prasinocladus_malaysianus.AAC.1
MCGTSADMRTRSCQRPPTANPALASDIRSQTGTRMCVTDFTRTARQIHVPIRVHCSPASCEYDV